MAYNNTGRCDLCDDEIIYKPCNHQDQRFCPACDPDDGTRPHLKVRLEQNQGGRWNAYLEGKGAPLVEPVPGNRWPARRAEWPTHQDAETALLARFGQPIDFVRTWR